MNACPSQEQLQQLLCENIDRANRNEVESHIEECSACQEMLAQLTDDRGDWRQDQSDDSSAGAQTDPFLERIKQHHPFRTPQITGAERDTVKIRFPVAPSDESPIGQLECFRILQVIGEGGFGCVYKGYDCELEQHVALKVLKPELAASETHRARFEREAKKAAAVRHDHVVTVHRLGKSDDFPLPFMVMEFVEGKPLGERIHEEKTLPPTEAAEIARQVASGLAAAHQGNVVHRDIKPSNILLCQRTGRAKITDFGIAREFEGTRLKVTQTGQIAGTLEYMSPEHIRTPDKVDGRSDVYSLGIVLYEMLTGEKPFRGVTHMVLQQQLQEEPSEPRKLNDKIPIDLQTITLKCLAKDPDKRYQSAGELADDLQRFLNREPIKARPVSRFESALKWIKRRPAAAAAWATSFVAALALVGASVAVGYNSKLSEKSNELEIANDHLNKMNSKLSQKSKELEDANAHLGEMNLKLNQKSKELGTANKNLEETNVKLAAAKDLAETRRREAVEAKHIAETRRKQAEEAKKRSEHLLYIAEMNRAHSIWTKGYALRTQGLIEKYEQPDHKPSLGFEYYYLRWLLAHSHKPQDKRLDGPLSSVAVGRNGTAFATALWNGKESEIKWSIRNPKLAGTIRVPDLGIHQLAFSPDGKNLIAACSESKTMIWKWRPNPPYFQERPSVILSGHEGAVLSIAFLNKQSLASGGQDGKICIWDLNKPGRRIASLPHSGPVNNMAVGRNGLLVAAVGKYSPSLRPAQSNTKVNKVLTRSGGESGSKIIGGLGASRGEIVLWKDVPADPTRFEPIRDHEDVVYDVAISPDGKTLASASFDHTIKLWRLEDGNTRPKLYATLTGHHQEVLSVAFDPSGQYLASAGWDMTVKVWDSRDGKPVESFSGHHGVVTEVAWFGETHLVSCGGGGFVKFWDSKNSQQSIVLKSEKRQAIFDAAFLGDTDQLVATSQNEPFRLWDAAKQQQGEASHSGPNQWGTISPNRKWIAVQKENTIHIVSPQTTKPSHIITESQGSSSRPVFSPDGKILAMIWRPDEQHGAFHPEAKVKLWHWRLQEKPAWEVEVPGAHCVAFHPTENKMAVAARDPKDRTGSVGITIWDVDKRQVIQEFRSSQGDAVRSLVGVNEMVFSPDGKLLATGNQDFTASVWDVATGKLVHSLEEHMCFVSSVAFSPDGSRLATGSEDWTVKLWDLQSGLSTITLTGHTGRVLNLSFNADGDKLVSTSEDGTLRIWPAPRKGSGLVQPVELPRPVGSPFKIKKTK